MNAKRNNRGYKIKDEFYSKAMKRAKKEKGHLATLIENVIICYAYGLDIKAYKNQTGGATALDVFDVRNSELISNVKSIKL